MIDVVKKGTRHFATYNRHTMIIIGFHNPTNTVYLINPGAMPSDQADELIRIAIGNAAQQSDTLAPILQNLTHSKSNQPWLAHLWQNKSWMATTFPDNLSDMNQDQKNFFKGFGRSLNEAEEKPEDTHHVIRQPQAKVETTEVPVAPVVDDELPVVSEGNYSGDTRGLTVTPVADPRMDALISAVTNLVKVVDNQSKEINRVLKRVPKAPGRPKGPAKPKVVNGRTVDAAIPPMEIVG